MTKYEYTGRTVLVAQGGGLAPAKLHEIRAICTFRTAYGTVTEGDLGGFIEGSDCLPNYTEVGKGAYPLEGSWVYEGCAVADGAKVTDRSAVIGCISENEGIFEVSNRGVEVSERGYVKVSDFDSYLAGKGISLRDNVCVICMTAERLDMVLMGNSLIDCYLKGANLRIK